MDTDFTDMNRDLVLVGRRTDRTEIVRATLRNPRSTPTLLCPQQYGGILFHSRKEGSEAGDCFSGWLLPGAGE